MLWQAGKVPAASSASPVTGLLSRRGVSISIQPLERPLVMNKFMTAAALWEGFIFYRFDKMNENGL